MKKSGYHTIFHIYRLFFVALFGTILVAIGLFLLVITIQKPDGATVRTDWPKTFTENFREQIIFIDDAPQVTQSGMELLQDNDIGLQILDNLGYEIYSYQKPKKTKTQYTNIELLPFFQTGHEDVKADKISSFIEEITHNGSEYAYILYFPMEIKKLTMYLNAERFTSGKALIIFLMGFLLIVILVLGIVYGFWTAKIIRYLTTSIKDISKRNYIPLQNYGVFGDIYSSLNTLDAEIKNSDTLREQTEKMRQEWIANITHDLKTPLSPIKGYAEILQDTTAKTNEQCNRYAHIMLKNVKYMENLIDDLKLTYQLENGMLPINRQKQNIIRFLRELLIAILNNPEYKTRSISFESIDDAILFSFDHALLTRAFQNLIINAFVHGDENTKITLQISVSKNMLNIAIADNGKGISAEQTSKLFERYYRGGNTEHKIEGTGLGLAITKDIVELHGGTISVSSTVGVGTVFYICFPVSKLS